MSERGRKIFTTVVWIVIFVGVIGYLTREIWHKESISGSDNAKLTRQEWAEILAEDYGDESLKENVTDGDMEATGEYVVLAAFTAVGEDRITQILQQDGMEGDSLGFALSKGIVSEDQLDREVTEEEARNILADVIAIDYSPEYCPDYIDMETKTTILDANGWDIRDIDEENGTLVATLPAVPEEGMIFAYTDKFGIANFKVAKSIEPIAGGEYKIYTEDVQDMSEIVDSVSFSGSGKFGYLTGEKDSVVQSEKQLSPTNPFVLTAHAEEAKKSGFVEWLHEMKESVDEKTTWEKEEEKNPTRCNIEIGTSIGSNETKTYLKITSQGASSTYTYDPDYSKINALKECLEIDYNNFEKSIEEKLLEGAKESSAETQIDAKIEITGLSVCSSGYFELSDPLDEKNKLDIKVRAFNTKVSASTSIKSEFRAKIISFVLPLEETGTVSVELEIFLVMDMEGNATLEYGIAVPSVEMSATVADGFHVDKYGDHNYTNVTAQVEIGAGIMAAIALKVGPLYLFDPGIDIRVCTAISTVDIPDGYEPKIKYRNSQCYDFNIKFPQVNAYAAIGGDDESVMYKFLDYIGADTSQQVCPEEKDDGTEHWLIDELYHVEWDNGLNMIQVGEGYKVQDVCTHIRPKPTPTPKPTPKPTPTPTHKPTKTQKPSLEDRVNDKIDEKKKETQIKVEQTINDAIYNFLMENCNGCY